MALPDSLDHTQRTKELVLGGSACSSSFWNPLLRAPVTRLPDIWVYWIIALVPILAIAAGSVFALMSWSLTH